MMVPRFEESWCIGGVCKLRFDLIDLCGDGGISLLLRFDTVAPSPAQARDP
ncbi:hypothetical protein TSUD_276260 [Trifolium subterraneum]|uniref:Uncharacterized protein n=1 Tax=Trifolium subterraneum TaxID=3900 RepID=A0A2Z6P2D2_TRISU|nr:hypothetical protein TSUD_276260 [Trifolium subterraneum]